MQPLPLRLLPKSEMKEAAAQYFPEWEVGGPPFASPAVAKRYATATPAALVSQWKTPTLVVHGGKDFVRAKPCASLLSGIPARVLLSWYLRLAAQTS